MRLKKLSKTSDPFSASDTRFKVGCRMASRLNRGGAFGAVGSGWWGKWNPFFDSENRMEPYE